jgi:hypothetical protein
MPDEEGMLAPSANSWIHQKQGHLVYQWMYALDPRPQLGLLAPADQVLAEVASAAGDHRRV